MSGGFFRGTSADQDTRFSNKAARLLKTQKFAPELDHPIDMKKVHLDSIRPWIATRVTQLLGFEDEVLINFVYGLLEEKSSDGKQIQIQLTGFMEKNTGKFMKELWGLLTSAQNSTTGIPQQLLDEKAEEAALKKAEEHRIISEVRKKEEERKILKQDMIKKEKEDNQLDSFIPGAPKQRFSLFSGRKSRDANRMRMRHGSSGSRPSKSRSGSISTVSSRSMSRSPPPPLKKQLSRSISISPPQRLRRSSSPLRRGRPPHHHRHRSRSPIRRVRLPISPYSPRRQHCSHSVSPRPQLPIPPHRSPRRRRSPQVPRSSRARSPVNYSPRRRSSPDYKRASPCRRTSFHSSRYRWRSPHLNHSPVRSHNQPASPGHCRYSPQRLSDMSPHRLPCVSRKAVSPPPRHHIQSLSAETDLKIPPTHRDSSSSPPGPSSASPHSSTRVSSAPHGKASFVSSPHKSRSLSEGKPIWVSASPVYDEKPANEYSSGSPSPMTLWKGENSFLRSTHDKHVQSRALALSPPKQQSSPSNLKGQSRTPPTVRVETRDTPAKIIKEHLRIIDGKRSGSSSRESSLSAEGQQVALFEKPRFLDASTFNTVVLPVEKVDRSLSNDYQKTSDCRKSRYNRDLESGGNEDHDSILSVSIDDQKAAKRHRKEKWRLHKEEKRRIREERYKRKEERRANKSLSKGIDSVTPPPHFNNCLPRYDDFDRMDKEKVQLDKYVEIEQRELENELRRKALDSIKAKKLVHM